MDAGTPRLGCWRRGRERGGWNGDGDGGGDVRWGCEIVAGGGGGKRKGGGGVREGVNWDEWCRSCTGACGNK